MNATTDPRRKEKVNRYKAPQAQGQNGSGTGNEDLTPDYMNILGMWKYGGWWLHQLTH